MQSHLKRFFVVFLGLGLSLAPVACGDGGTGPLDPTELEFDASLGVDLTQMIKTASGLYYQDLVVGDGAEVTAGQTVTVHYTGWIYDGTKFDSSLPGDPVTFSLAGNLIQGWKEGVPRERIKIPAGWRATSKEV